jgi:glycosyltransferase involved in cell wall biosynthesis
VGEAIRSAATGYLVPERDVEAMSRMAGAILSDGDRWRSFSAAGIEHVRADFDIKKCTPQLESIYDRIIREHPVKGAA